jgi:hypothetical protein
MIGLNLEGAEMEAMLNKIAAENENKVTIEANTKEGVQITAGRTWSNGFGFFGYGRAKSKKDAEAGVKAEFKW